MRIDRLLANQGIGSRSEVKALIRSGAVKVNGETVKDPGAPVDELRDAVELRGETLTYRKYVYIMMNKPAGVLSGGGGVPTDKTAAMLLPAAYAKFDLSPAGRLDKDSEGLLLLTNDGDFVHDTISPSKKVKKRYFIRVGGELTDADREAFEAGIILGDGTALKPAGLEILKAEGGLSEAVVTISEGKYHQVKRMVLARGKRVTYLKRLSIGALSLDMRLGPGEFRELTEEELEIVKSRG